MIYWIWMKNISGIGPHAQRKLLKTFENPKEVYCVKFEDLIAAGLSEKQAKAVLENKSLNEAEKVLRDCERFGISIVNISEQNFPTRMRSINDMPVVLYYKGIMFEPDKTSGIVGPRKCSQQTKNKTIDITARCIKEGNTIVSGMALGVDGYAHTSALKNKGKTIAIVGHGLDMCFPKAHQTLFEAIKKNGCVISEYDPGVPALSYHFPRRNAIIAALSDTLYVVDAGRNSGSLITASFAEKYGKRCIRDF